MKKHASIVFLFMCLLMTGCQVTTDSLIGAIEKDDLAGVQKIVKQINVNEKSKNNVIPLFLAVEKGDSEIVSALIEAGARCDITDEEGNTPLHIAILNNSEDTIDLLLDKSNLDAENAEGKTPLALAEEKNDYSLLSKVYFEKNDIDNTIKYGEQAIQKDGGDTTSKYYLGMSLLKHANALKYVGNLEEAIAVAERVNNYCGEILAVKPDADAVTALGTETLEFLNTANSELAEKQAAEQAAAEKAAAEQAAAVAAAEQAAAVAAAEKAAAVAAAEQAAAKKAAEKSASSSDSSSKSEYVTCPTCKGFGKVECKNCKGKGYYEAFDELRECSRCDGTGWSTCGKCGGTGERNKKALESEND